MEISLVPFVKLVLSTTDILALLPGGGRGVWRSMLLAEWLKPCVSSPSDKAPGIHSTADRREMRQGAAMPWTFETHRRFSVMTLRSLAAIATCLVIGGIVWQIGSYRKSPNNPVASDAGQQPVALALDLSGSWELYVMGGAHDLTFKVSDGQIHGTLQENPRIGGPSTAIRGTHTGKKVEFSYRGERIPLSPSGHEQYTGPQRATLTGRVTDPEHMEGEFELTTENTAPGRIVSRAASSAAWQHATKQAPRAAQTN